MILSQAGHVSPVPLSGQFNIDHEGDGFFYAGEGFEIRRHPGLVNYGLWVEKIWSDTCFIPMTDETCSIGESLDVSFTTPVDTYMGIGDATIGGSTYDNVTLRGTLDFDSHRSSSRVTCQNSATGGARSPSRA